MSPQPRALFGELRSLLQQPPSAPRWDALCAHLDLWSPAALEEIALPYALDLLEPWPRALRVTPRRWLEQARSDAAPQLALCRTLASPPEQLGWVDDALMTALAGCAALSGITALTLQEQAIGMIGAAALAASPHLTRLTSLALTSNPLGAEGAASIAASRSLSSLRSLDLSWCGIGDGGALALAASDTLSHLEHLDLCGDELLNEGGLALARSPLLRTVVTLDLSFNWELSDAACVPLIERADLTRLTHIDLQATASGPGALRALCRAPMLDHLVSAMLYSADLSLDTARIIAASPRLASLETLHFALNGAEPDALRLLAATPHLPAALRDAAQLKLAGS
jgi:hypothetical protein